MTRPIPPKPGHPVIHFSQGVDNSVDVSTTSVDWRGTSTQTTWMTWSCARTPQQTPTAGVDSSSPPHLWFPQLSTVSTDATTQTRPSMRHDEPQPLPGRSTVETWPALAGRVTDRRRSVSEHRARMAVSSTDRAQTTNNTSGGLVLRKGR